MTDFQKVFVQWMIKLPSVSSRQLLTEWLEQDILTHQVDNTSRINQYCATVTANKMKRALLSKSMMLIDWKFLPWFLKCIVVKNLLIKHKITTKVGFTGITKTSVLTEQFMNKSLYRMKKKWKFLTLNLICVHLEKFANVWSEHIFKK